MTILFLFHFTINFSFSQTFPIGSNSIDEKMRDLQLQGKLNQKYSFLNRPYNNDHFLSIDSIVNRLDTTFKYSIPKYELIKNIHLQLLQI